MVGHFRRWFIDGQWRDDEAGGNQKLDFGSVTHSLRTSRDPKAARIAQRTSDFDSLSDSVLASIEAAYGITDDLQVSGRLDITGGAGFLGATSGGWRAGGDCLRRSGGLTDLWITGKYRFLKGKPGEFGADRGDQVADGPR